MSSVAPTIQGRMICACVWTYSIQNDGTLSPNPPYDAAAGFTSPPTPFVAGLDEIDACFVGTNQDGVVLAFRGTLPPNVYSLQSWIDWLNDFYAATEAVEGIPGKVHTGFWDALDDLWPQLLPEVQKQLKASGKPLYVTGHSKGGALAALAAVRLLQQAGIKATALYTFAAPRAGDDVFAASYPFTSVHTRYEYADDIVPHLPPSGSFIDVLKSLPYIGQYFAYLQDWNYTSVGTLQFINWTGGIQPESVELELERGWHLTTQLVELHLQQIAADHHIDCGSGYMSAISPTGVCPVASRDGLALLLKAARRPLEPSGT